MNRLLHSFLATLIAVLLLLVSCGKDTPPEPEGQHTAAVKELISLMDANPSVKALLERSISQAASINPDRRYNPAQSLYGRTDQGVGYFWFIVDQPLDELKGLVYYYPTVEFVEPFSSWLTTYASSWGDWLSTSESWNSSYYNIVASDPDWGLSNGWYEDASNWRSFNDFFSRKLSSPSARPLQTHPWWPLQIPGPKSYGRSARIIGLYIRQIYRSRIIQWPSSTST